MLAAFVAMTLDPQPERTPSVVGELLIHENVRSSLDGSERDVRVWLPPGYEDEADRRYPVLYLLDGQNVFDGMTSYIPNQEWQADETVTALAQAGEIEPIIVVGVDNRGVHRADEYLPTRRNFGEPMGGRAREFGRFLASELKDLIDTTYRTKPDRDNTGLGGASFGGNAALAIGLSESKTFGKIIAMSTSVWWDDQELVRRVSSYRGRPSARIWLDVGGEEGDDMLFGNESLRDALIDQGWRLDQDLRFVVDDTAEHNEIAWARRLPFALKFLFPPG